MKKYEDVILDRSGNPVTGATVTVKDYPSLTSSTVYSSNVIGANANPLTTDANGRFTFYAKDGHYSLEISKVGITTTTQSDIEIRENAGVLVNLQGKGVALDGATDDAIPYAAAIAGYVGRRLYHPSGTAKVTTGQTIADSDGTILQGDGKTSVLKKFGNIDLLTLGKIGEVRSMFLDGNGGSFTGRGIVISSGALTDYASARVIADSWIIGTASYGVEVTAANYGYASIIYNCKIIPQTLSVPAVKFTVVGETNGNRTLAFLFTGSNPIVDFGESDNTQVIGCQGGEPIYSANTIKAMFFGGRIVSNSGTLGFNGQYNGIVGCSISTGAITFNANLQYSVFRGNTISQPCTITDNAPGVSKGNEIDLPFGVFSDYNLSALTWAGNAGNPAAGNAVINTYCKRDGVFAYIAVDFTMGNTTTFGSGFWIIGGLPYAPTRRTLGTWYAKDASTGNEYGGVAVIEAGAHTITLVSSVDPTKKVESTVPFAWATSDILSIEIPRLPIN